MLRWGARWPAGTRARRVRITGSMGHCRLREEHEAARRLLAQLGSGIDVRRDLAALLEAHFRFEEEEVLPLLATRLPIDTGPLAVVRDEHVTLLGLVSDLQGVDGDTLDARRRLQTLLRSHFEKEEELLLPFAHQALTPQERERLGCGAVAETVAETETESAR